MTDKPGPTGEFPEGKLHETDEGGLNIGIGNKEGKVFMDFGKDIRWIAFDPEGARKIAEMLLVRADAAEKEIN